MQKERMPRFITVIRKRLDPLISFYMHLLLIMFPFAHSINQWCFEGWKFASCCSVRRESCSSLCFLNDVHLCVHVWGFLIELFLFTGEGSTSTSSCHTETGTSLFLAMLQKNYFEFTFNLKRWFNRFAQFILWIYFFCWFTNPFCQELERHRLEMVWTCLFPQLTTHHMHVLEWKVRIIIPHCMWYLLLTFNIFLHGQNRALCCGSLKNATIIWWIRLDGVLRKWENVHSTVSVLEFTHLFVQNNFVCVCVYVYHDKLQKILIVVWDADMFDLMLQYWCNGYIWHLLHLCFVFLWLFFV